MLTSVSRTSLFRMALLASGALAASSLAQAQEAVAAPEAQVGADDAAPDDAIVVTGFRQSLQAAFNVKKNAVGAVEGVSGVEVNMTFDPPWTPDRMSEEAQVAVGWY